MQSRKLITHIKTNAVARNMLYVTLFLSIAPYVFFLLGGEFSHRDPEVVSNLKVLSSGDIFDEVSGAFIHTILEWTAVLIATITVILAFIHYHINRNQISTVIIGLSLFFAGLIDAYHTFLSDHLMFGPAESHDLIQFTWTMSRLLNAVLMCGGVIYFVLQYKKYRYSRISKNYWLILIFALIFGLLALEIVHYVTTHPDLPVTSCDSCIVKRPFDLLPLLIFVISFTVIYPLFFQRYAGPFSYAICLSAIPEIATQIHMAIGSEALNDSHYFIAHFLKVVAYGVPFSGLIMDYVYRTNLVKKQRQQLLIERSQREMVEVELKGQHGALNNAAIICEFDESGNILFVNENYLTHSELTYSKVIGRNINHIWEEKFKKEYEEEIWEVLKSGESWFGQTKNVNNSKETYFVDTVINPVTDKYGELLKYIMVDFDVTKEVQSAEQLYQKSIDLERSNKELEQFAYIASHDLQSPLRTISSYAMLLEKECGDSLEGEGKEFLKQLGEGANRMQALIKGLLMLSTIQKNDQELAEVDCNKLLSNIIEDNGVLIKEAQASIEYNRLPIIIGIESQISQLFFNLVSNGIKYVRRGTRPTVRIKAYDLKDFWRFEVIDNGIGINKVYQNRIFQIFQRLDPRRYEGNGIGLSICKKIVEVHQGEIGIESEEGAGTTFYFTIKKPLQ